jgi:glycosyltransferase involved in cell wall biosynthesis
MFSLVIPTFNRADDLRQTISQILLQDCQDYEILVIDNGPSTDGTEDLVRGFRDSNSNIRYVRSRRQGVTIARELGNKLAVGEIIVQMDSDVSVLDPKTLSLAERLFGMQRVDILGVLELHDQNEAERHIGRNNHHLQSIREYTNTNGIGRITTKYDISSGFEKLAFMPRGLYEIQSFRSCFMAYRRTVLQQTGPWDENYVHMGSKVGMREETDFLLRAYRMGCRIMYTNLTAIWHRAGSRIGVGVPRGVGVSYHWHLSAAHAYMAVKDMLEKKDRLKILPWMFHQLFMGGPKNPGAISILRMTKSPTCALAAIGGFMRGVFSGIVLRRRFTASPRDNIV